MTAIYKKFVASLVIGLSVLGLLVWIMLVPLMDQIKKASQEYMDGQEVLARLNKREASYRDLKREYEEDKNGILATKGFFLEEEEIVTFISTLETIAAQTGNDFEIKTATSHDPSEEDEDSYLILRISLWGSFKGLLNFIANVEDSPYPPYRLIEVDNLSIQKYSPKTGSENYKNFDLEATLGIRVYTQ